MAMKQRIKRFCADRVAAVTSDYLVLLAFLLVTGLAVGGAVRVGTFEAIAEVLTDVDGSGCVQTSASGTTDLSACQ